MKFEVNIEISFDASTFTETVYLCRGTAVAYVIKPPVSSAHRSQPLLYGPGRMTSQSDLL